MHELWRITQDYVKKNSIETLDSLEMYKLIIESLKDERNYKHRDHLVRLMQHNGADEAFIDKFYNYVNAPTKIRTKHSLESLILRYGNQETANDVYRENREKNRDGLLHHYNSLSDTERKQRNHGYYDFYLKKHNGDDRAAKKEYREYLNSRSAISKESVKKTNAKKRSNKTIVSTSIEYFLKKYGGDLDLAKRMQKERQRTRSLVALKQRYGAREGYKRWRRSIRLWLRTLNSKSTEEKLRINSLKASGPPSNVSKESISFFEYLGRITDEQMQFGKKGKEFSLVYDGCRRFYYDCFIPSCNLIIEYHGTSFHPKPGQFNWTGYRGATYREARAKDIKKKKLAESFGYRVIEIYSDEDVEVALGRIVYCINESVKENANCTSEI